MTLANIRFGAMADVNAITQIFNWYAENGHATFSEKTSIEERTQWMKQFRSETTSQIVVAELDGRVVGYACSLIYRGNSVFSRTVETSVYIHPEHGGKGIGSQLYDVLLKELKRSEIHRVVVGIALPNDGSVAFHKKYGFENVGVFDEYAFYKGQYYSSLWMQKKL